MRLFGVIGHPLGHSLSPVLHNWAFAQAQFPGIYLAWPQPSEKLPDFMTALRTLPISGVSVTIPHKESVMPYCEIVTEAASTVGAVNTLFWEDGKLVGDNTDLAGFLAPLQARFKEGELPSALVLGAGGAARAVLAGLAKLRVKEVFLANRSPERSAGLAAEFNAVIVDWEERASVNPDLLVNATPLGMAGERAESTPWLAESFRPGQTAYDLVYNPLETRFLREAKAAGCGAIDGLSMFLGQAVEQFQRWTGAAFDLRGARELLLNALANR
jgi:shikimate dehydrogenase